MSQQWIYKEKTNLFPAQPFLGKQKHKDNPGHTDFTLVSWTESQQWFIKLTPWLTECDVAADYNREVFDAYVQPLQFLSPADLDIKCFLPLKLL